MFVRENSELICHLHCILRLWLMCQDIFFIVQSLEGVYRCTWYVLWLLEHTYLNHGITHIKLAYYAWRHFLNTQRPITFTASRQHSVLGYGSSYFPALCLLCIQVPNAVRVFTNKEHIRNSFLPPFYFLPSFRGNYYYVERLCTSHCGRCWDKIYFFFFFLASSLQLVRILDA